MAVPRNRVSNSRKNTRRSHGTKKPIQLIKCPNCQKTILPHRLCLSCGYYKGKEVINASAEE